MIRPLPTDSIPGPFDQAPASLNRGLVWAGRGDVAKAIETRVCAIIWHDLFIHMPCVARLCNDVAAPTYGEMT
jgi:hypothetical protein